MSACVRVHYVILNKWESIYIMLSWILKNKDVSLWDYLIQAFSFLTSEISRLATFNVYKLGLLGCVFQCISISLICFIHLACFLLCRSSTRNGEVHFIKCSLGFWGNDWAYHKGMKYFIAIRFLQVKVTVQSCACLYTAQSVFLYFSISLKYELHVLFQRLCI